MGKFEQAAPQTDASHAGFSAHEGTQTFETSRSAVTSARSSADDVAQKTVDKQFGTPQIEGLNGDPKTGNSNPESQANVSDGSQATGGRPANDASIGGQSEDRNDADGKGSEQNMKSGKAEELETNSKNGNNGDLGKEKTLNADDLQKAAELGKLNEVLTNAGVDVNDPKAVNAYLNKAFDNHIIQGLTLAGEKLPANPSDADLGKALLPAVSKSPEVKLKAALEADPAAGYASIRQNFVTMQNQALSQEKQ